MNSLQSMGLNDHFKNCLIERNLSPNDIGRVLRQDKTQYLIKTLKSEDSGELTGNILHAEEEYPAVGDWVQVVDFDDKYIITQLIPRYSQLTRKSIHSNGKAQLIAANIDQAFIVQSLDNDFSINRLERYITMAYDGGITPIVTLNKIDLVKEDELKAIESSIKVRINADIQVISVSALQNEGFETLKDLIISGTTSCFLGSSGVGKSTIVNLLLKSDLQPTSAISSSTGKGQHTTTSKQLFFLEGAGMIIDTPGLRDLGMSVSDESVQTGFGAITELAQGCKFSDCTHSEEPGCAVQEAVISGCLDFEQLDNYHKLKSESQRFQKTKAEMNKEGKRFGKIYKQAQAYRKIRKL